jgi:lantibiotic modifying enzyme
MGLNARRSPGLSPEGQSRPASVPATGEHDAARGFCHGSSGMAVARILGRGEMEHAVLFSQGDEEMELDHLCCGSSGIIDLGLELGRSVVPSLLSTSRRRAAGMLMRAASPEAYRLRLTADFQRPGLFDGLAGIGFMWLRLYDPRLPCLLLRNPWPR